MIVRAFFTVWGCFIFQIFQLGRMGDPVAGGAFRKFPGAEHSHLIVRAKWRIVG